MKVGDDEELLHTARGRALNAYAEYEAELCYVLAALLNTRQDTAAIILVKVVNSGARTAIISNLVDHIHGDKFKSFWHGHAGGHGVNKAPGLLRLINKLDSRRNQIVHWTVAGHTLASPGGIEDRNWTDLRPPFNPTSSTSLGVNDLAEFCEMAKFIARALRQFWLVTRHPQKFSESEQQSWLRIFQQPVPYPPLADSPLYLLTKT